MNVKVETAQDILGMPLTQRQEISIVPAQEILTVELDPEQGTRGLFEADQDQAMAIGLTARLIEISNARGDEIERKQEIFYHLNRRTPMLLERILGSFKKQSHRGELDEYIQTMMKERIGFLWHERGLKVLPNISFMEANKIINELVSLESDGNMSKEVKISTAFEKISNLSHTDVHMLQEVYRRKYQQDVFVKGILNEAGNLAWRKWMRAERQKFYDDMEHKQTRWINIESRKENSIEINQRCQCIA